MLQSFPRVWNGVIVGWNSGAEGTYGYTETEAIGKPINILFPPELRLHGFALFIRQRTDILSDIDSDNADPVPQ